MQSRESVLIIDDDRSACKLWSEALKAQGYETLQAASLHDARDLFETHDFGLALVNVKSNGHVRGLDALDWIQENAPAIDVIVVSANPTLESSIGALRKGAYDYLVKPVTPVEVVSRVERCLTRREEKAERLQMISQIELMLNQLKAQLTPEGEDGVSHDDILETTDIIVDRRKRLVVQEGEPVQLSPTEFDILDYLVANSDRVVSASEIIQAVQGYEMEEMEARPIVRVNIRRLRQKIEDDTSNPRHIVTVRSRGYRFSA